MDSSFFVWTFAAVGLFTLLGTMFFMVYSKFRFRQNNKILHSPSLSPLSPQSSSSPNWKHHVFPSFHGADVRKTFLSHILKELRSKGIDPFIDNDIERSKSIGPELVEAIRGSRIAIVLLSKNYASSTWCMNELVEIIKCREDLSQTVMTIFYEVDPTDVKKQTGDFGKVFKKTCVGKTKVDCDRWRQALAEIAKIAGYHSNNWDNEAVMIENIATDISNKLNSSMPSSDFTLVGMGAHTEKIRQLLRLQSYEVRMIGIWGPSGIGKTTIARFLFNLLSKNFQLSVFIENIKESYTRPCSDDYSAKLHLQQQFMSQIINQKDIKISHLGVIQDRLKDKKVLVVLDGVDQSIQIDAMAKETWWFGPGSRIIITTQDRGLLRAHGINRIYEVGFPETDEALQIFCMFAFGQKSPYDGFEELARVVTKLSGKLPLGLRVMGSYFRGMSKQDWTKALPRLRTRLNGEIESILKFSYDALCDEDKDLFLYIACFFNYKRIEKVREHLAKFFDVGQGLHVLAEKSLISMNWGKIEMHTLLVLLGKEIAHKQSLHDHGKHHFLVDVREICEVLCGNTIVSKRVTCMAFNLSKMDDELSVSERAFEGISNLQFLILYGNLVHDDRLHILQGLNGQFRNLRLLNWEHFPMTCLPSTFNTKFLIEIYMYESKLERLWEGLKPLRNLKWMYLSGSRDLEELPDLSTATNLKELDLSDCSSLLKLPSSIGNATILMSLNLSGCSSLMEVPSSIENAINLKKLDLNNCFSLIEFPSSIGKATNLEQLDLNGCSKLVELPQTIGNVVILKELNLSDCTNLVRLPSSIGNLQKLSKLIMPRCTKVEALPININLDSLYELYLNDCTLLKSFPDISKNTRRLRLNGTAVEKVPSSLSSWSHLLSLDMSGCKGLMVFPPIPDSIQVLDLSKTDIERVPPWAKNLSRLTRLELKMCRKLVSLPQLSDSLKSLDATDCESLERLDCLFHNPEICLNFSKCFKLNQEARDLIIKTSPSGYEILPGGEVPLYSTYRAIGDSITVKLNEIPFLKSIRFKACVVLVVKKCDSWASDVWISLTIMEKQNSGVVVPCKPNEVRLSLFTEHLYTFETEAEVTSNELDFEFKIDNRKYKIAECGVLQVLAVHHVDDSFGDGSCESSDSDKHQ